jgi:hypothetical protein
MKTVMGIIIYCLLSSLGYAKTGGGVDVGNFSVKIPDTQLNILLPGSWKIESRNNILEASLNYKEKVIAHIYHPTSKTISNSKELIEDVNALNKNEIYHSVVVNGLNGAKYFSPEKSIQKLYLISPTHEIVYIESKSSGNRETAHQVANSVYFKYQGVEDKNAMEFTLDMNPQMNSSLFSLEGACLYKDCPYSQKVFSQFFIDPRDSKPKIKIGTSGYDSGKVIDLNLSENDFDNIFVKGEFISLPSSTIKLESVYEKFSTKAPIQDLSTAEVKKGHIYFVRTISWPKEDSLFKLVVNSVDVNNGTLNITVRKLAYIPEYLLQENIHFINEYTIKYEAVKNEGEVNLYDQRQWAGEYAPSCFNFQYGTRDNMYITHNSWDLQFTNLSHPFFFYAGSAGDHGDVIDLGMADLEQINVNSFPATSRNHSSMVEVIEGHVYLIMSYKLNSVTWAAVKVATLEPGNNRWVKLNWKKILFLSF